MNIGLELTFIPKDKKEFTTKKKVTNKIKEFNKRLRKKRKKSAIDTYVKYDIFDLKKITYCIEIECLVKINHNLNVGIDDMIKDYSEYSLYSIVDPLFKIAKEMGLAGRIIEKKKDVIFHHPTGEGHLHLGLDNLLDSCEGLLFFENKMVEEFLRNPFIYPLFQEPFSQLNCKTIDYDVMAREVDLLDKNNFSENIKNLFFDHHYLFYPRMFRDRTYPTFEFRFFTAQNNIGEVIADVNFLVKFAKYCSLNKTRDFFSFKSFKKEMIKLKEYQKKLKNLSFAKKEIKNFFKKIDCEWNEIYEKKFEINYKNRVKYGKYFPQPKTCLY